MPRLFIALAALLSLAGVLAVTLQPSDGGVPELRAEEPRAPTAKAPPLLRGIRPVETAEEATEEDPILPSPEVEEVEGTHPNAAPPDPVERGTCVLALELVDDVAQAAFDTKLDLFRIDEPGNAGWLRGDRKLETVKTTKGRVEVPGLAPGRYRIRPRGQRRGSKDPAPFDVSGARTDVRLELPVTRLFAVRLRVYDEAGQLLQHAHKQSGGCSAHSTFPGDPGWMKQRELRKGRLARVISGGAGIGRGPGLGRKRRIRAVKGTFEIAKVREPARYSSRSDTWHVHLENGARLSFYLKGEEQRDVTYVAVTAPMADLREAVRLPDGTRAIAAGAKITVRCRPVLVPANGLEPSFRDIPIQVQVRLKGYADLDFEHTLASPATDRVLEPR